MHVLNVATGIDLTVMRFCIRPNWPAQSVRPSVAVGGGRERCSLPHSSSSSLSSWRWEGASVRLHGWPSRPPTVQSERSVACSLVDGQCASSCSAMRSEPYTRAGRRHGGWSAQRWSAIYGWIMVAHAHTLGALGYCILHVCCVRLFIRRTTELSCGAILLQVDWPAIRYILEKNSNASDVATCSPSVAVINQSLYIRINEPIIYSYI